jgi:hypothetical protein
MVSIRKRVLLRIDDDEWRKPGIFRKGSPQGVGAGERKNAMCFFIYVDANNFFQKSGLTMGWTNRG